MSFEHMNELTPEQRKDLAEDLDTLADPSADRLVAVEINIACDNAAFEVPGPELARILRLLADRVEDWTHDTAEANLRIRDINGNRVGYLKADFS